MARAKSKATGAAPKKRLGRPPKSAAKAAATTKATTTKAAKAAPKGRGGRPPKAPPAVDGRRIPVSPQTARAESAAERAGVLAKDALQALREARDAAAKAREKAKASGAAGDKTALKKVRAKVARTVKKVGELRRAWHEAKVRVAELKADDRYKARVNHVEVRLRQADLAASARIDSRLERAVRKFRDDKEAELHKAEGRKARARKQQAEKSLAALAEEKNAKVEAARALLEPKPRKKRRKRRAAAA